MVQWSQYLYMGSRLDCTNWALFTGKKNTYNKDLVPIIFSNNIFFCTIIFWSISYCTYFVLWILSYLYSDSLHFYLTFEWMNNYSKASRQIIFILVFFILLYEAQKIWNIIWYEVKGFVFEHEWFPTIVSKDFFPFFCFKLICFILFILIFFYNHSYKSTRTGSSNFLLLLQ